MPRIFLLFFARNRARNRTDQYGEDGKEDLEYRLLHVYYSAKRAVNKGIKARAENKRRTPPPPPLPTSHTPFTTPGLPHTSGPIAVTTSKKKSRLAERVVTEAPSSLSQRRGGGGGHYHHQQHHHHPPPETSTWERTSAFMVPSPGTESVTSSVCTSPLSFEFPPPGEEGGGVAVGVLVVRRGERPQGIIRRGRKHRRMVPGRTGGGVPSRALGGGRTPPPPQAAALQEEDPGGAESLPGPPRGRRRWGGRGAAQ